jgi:hypothetical protein
MACGPESREDPTAKVRVRNEVLFTAPNRVGLLADVTERLLAESINILAIRAYEEGDAGKFLLLTDDSRATADALSPLEGSLTIMPVIVAEVPNEPGQLNDIARALSAADINVSQVHATTTRSGEAMIILETDDAIAAMAVLERA